MRASVGAHDVTHHRSPADDLFGDLRRVHRSGLLACQFRATTFRHKEIELAAHELIQYFDAAAPGRRGRGRPTR
ncbi:MAG: hypothetical protein ABIR11_05190 [Candidatus Limnocylindrales bacterium]